ncbi:MAG: flagellin [Alphaproteobacteria bacterium]
MAGGITGLTNTAANSIGNVYSEKTAGASDAAQMIASGTRNIRASIDSSSMALSMKLDTNIRVLEQAGRNAAQAASVLQVAVGAQQNIADLLSSMKTLTTKANDDSQDDNARALIDADYQKLSAMVDLIADQARWNNQSLLSAGSGTTALAGAVTLASSNVDTTNIGNSFSTTAPINVTKSHGMISGEFTNVTVNQPSTNLYEISVEMKNQTPGGTTTQTFMGTATAPTANGELVLRSTTDEDNVLVFTLGADVSTITNAATYQSEMRTLLRVGSGTVGATLTSYSTAVNNGVTGITASTSTQAGTYAVRYDSASNVMRLTKGDQFWDLTATTAGAQTFTFANGVSVTTDGTFALGTSVTQMVFDVGTGGQRSMNFQVAEKSSDTITVNIASSRIADLGLTGTNVLKTADAGIAADQLDIALQSMSTSIAQMGAQQKQMEAASRNLETTIQNNQDAKAVYNDANVPEAMAKLTKDTVFANLSNAMLSQAFELQRGLVQIVS